MILKDLIKTFEFTNDQRDLMDLTGGLRLHPGVMGSELPRIELPRQAEPDEDLYSISTTLTAKTWLTTPMSVKEWRGFEAVIEHPRDPDGGAAVLTTAYYRLSDGVDEYYWDGGAWAVVGAGDWSDEADVANNIASFAATVRAIQVVINLRTSDERITPVLTSIKVLYGASIDHQEDYLLRSLIPDLKANVRPAGRSLFEHNGGTSVLLQEYQPETPYDIASIDAVFNEDTDTAHLFDLYDSYDADTGEITLNADPGAANLFVRFIYVPQIALNTSRDYTEVGKVPSLSVENVRILNSSIRPFNDSVVNKDDHTAVKVFGPRQADIEFDIIADTDKIVDQQRLAQAVRDYLANTIKLVSVGMDEEFRLQLMDDYVSIAGADKSDISSGRVRAKIVGAVFFERDSEQTYAVSSFKTTSNGNLVLQVP